jgi:5-formyltetrahydrofolate cyclo-ligase
VRWSVLKTLPARPDSPRPATLDHIPDFPAREDAARRLLGTPEYARAVTIFVAPDLSTSDMVLIAPLQDRYVVMASPALHQGFLLMGAEAVGEPITLSELTRHGPFDLLVTGSVAVTPRGDRLGKGAGYFDLEHALFSEYGLVNDESVIATVVHDSQIVNDSWPTRHDDVRVQLVVTPSTVVRTGAPPRIGRVSWSSIQPERMRIPPVMELRHRVEQNPPA